MSELICKVSVNNIPDPNISGLEPSERIASIYTHLRAFSPHFKRVLEQQTDLQPPTSPLLTELDVVSTSSRRLVLLINNFYHNYFPNLPLPEPAGGPTTLPPPQNVFQQKVYGCVVLRTYKELLSNISKDLRTLKNKVCRRRIAMIAFFWRWAETGLRQPASSSTLLTWWIKTEDEWVWRWQVHQHKGIYLWYLIFILTSVSRLL